MVARAFAVSTGFRYGTIITLVTRRRRVVLAATNAISESWSSTSPFPGKSPETV